MQTDQVELMFTHRALKIFGYYRLIVVQMDYNCWFKHAGILCIVRNILNITLYTEASSEAHHFIVKEETRSGPAALLLFCLYSRLLSSYIKHWYCFIVRFFWLVWLWLLDILFVTCPDCHLGLLSLVPVCWVLAVHTAKFSVPEKQFKSKKIMEINFSQNLSKRLI